MTPEEVIEAAKEDLPQIVGSKVYIGWDGGRDNLQITLTLRENRRTPLSGSENRSPKSWRKCRILSIDQYLEDESMPEIQLVINRDAASKYGLSATTIGYTVASALRANYLPDNRSTTMTST